MFRLLLAALLLPATTLAASAQTTAERNASAYAPLPPDQAAMKAHVLFLAADALKGRDTGSEEYEVAANYVAAQFFAQGLRPAGDAGGYLQRVPLVATRPADQGRMTVARGRRRTELAFGRDYVPAGDPRMPRTQLTAPVVFVGEGIVAPQFGRDDYAGVDVTGKIVVFFGGAPESFPGEERAHFGSDATKARLAADRGAVGWLELGGGRGPDFEGRVARWRNEHVTWTDTEDRGFIPGAPELGELSEDGAEKLFAGAAMDWEEVATRRSAGAALPAQQLPATLAVTLNSENRRFASSNVAGLLPGSDSRLKSELVVLSAHLDHVGVGDPVDGDSIYNGAEDNAVGIASLIEEARRFRESGKPPKRSILFLAVTAEEKGLVGSDYFARHPTTAAIDGGLTMVADVNLDMPIITYMFEDMIAFGADRSTLGPIVRRAVAKLGVGFGPDPQPEMGLFTRSDHYRFVQQGVPSVFLWPGHKGPGADATAAFLRDHYHKPSDEASLPLNWAAGVKFIDVNYAIAREIADSPERPRWNKGDFFGTLYNGYGAN